MDEFTKTKVKKIMDEYIRSKIPKQLQDQIKMNYKIRGNNVTIIEERPAFRSEQWVQHDIAQLRRDEEGWKVYWKDSRSKWHYVDDIEPNESFEKQLEIIDKDNRGMFWG